MTPPPAAPWLPIEALHALAAFVLATVAVQIALDRAHPRRAGSAAFWTLLAACFAARLLPQEFELVEGTPLVPFAVGLAVIAMVALAAAKQVRPPAWRAPDLVARAAEAARLRHRLLLPLLVVGAVAAAGALALPGVVLGGRPLADRARANTVAIGVGVLVAMGLALRLTRAPGARPPLVAQLRVPLREGGALLQQLGWALILPQLLATLGGVFERNGVGTVIASHAQGWLPAGQPLVAVVAYCAAMPLFTILMGNAFAAFPLITLGIGIPFIVREHGGDPAVMGAFGMLAGYCGTLVTPMAANFNVVPAVLLRLQDRHGVIKAQAPFALACWCFNTAAMAALVYRVGGAR